LGYLSIAASETLKEWKVVITSVEQEYKSTKERQDYRTGSGITYGGKGISIDIGKAKDNYDKDKKSGCFNCNIYRHMVKDCKKLKKEKEAIMCYKCNKVEHLAKNYKLE